MEQRKKQKNRLEVRDRLSANSMTSSSTKFAGCALGLRFRFRLVSGKRRTCAIGPWSQPSSKTDGILRQQIRLRCVAMKI